jgi:hypothetical protein
MQFYESRVNTNQPKLGANQYQMQAQKICNQLGHHSLAKLLLKEFFAQKRTSD